MAHCAIDPGGDAYVTWQMDVGGGNQDIWLGRVPAGAASMDATLPVEQGPLNPLGGWGTPDRKPYEAADGSRVAVAFGTWPNGSSWLSASTSLEPLTMAPLAAVGSPTTADVEEFQKPHFRPNGDLWVAWHWTRSDLTPVEEYIAVSREESGWAFETLSDDAPGEPCDCCPLDIQSTTNGDVLVVYRNNESNVRDHYVARAPGGGAFTTPVPGSSTNWTVFGGSESGPRVLGLTGDDALLIWSDPTAGQGRVWVAHSTDAGQSWAGDHHVFDAGGDQRLATMTRADDGRVWLGYGIFGETGRLTSSDNGGASFTEPRTLDTPDGPLDGLELCAGGGRAGAVGTTTSGALYWAELPVQ